MALAVISCEDAMRSRFWGPDFVTVILDARQTSELERLDEMTARNVAYGHDLTAAVNFLYFKIDGVLSPDSCVLRGLLRRATYSAWPPIICSVQT